MYFIVSKVLQGFLWPVSWALLALGYAFYLARRWRHRVGQWTSGLAFVYLLATSLPIVSTALRRPLEAAVPSYPIAQYPAAGMIVVLGGTQVGIAPPRFEPDELTGSRLLTAARLFHSRKAPGILVTGGVPYRLGSGIVRTEADDMRDILVDMGVPNAAILLEETARNTVENADFSAKILRQRGISDILLVTSALHMPRALKLFQATGLKVTPVPTSREVGEGPLELESLIPAAVSVSKSTYSIKEYIGRWIGRF